MVGALLEQKTVEWVTCGHDHNNDYWGKYQSINLAYGRKTGFGSYGANKNGARVFEITQEPYGIQTWIREDGGSVVVQEPHSRGFLESSQLNCADTATRWEQISAAFP